MTRLRGITGIATWSIAAWTAPASADAVTEWNALALGCITRPGPTGLLDLALVQAAVHDAVQAIEGKYEPYLATPAATGQESVGAAAAAAAYTVLSDSRICPDSAQPTLDTAFAPYLAGNDAGLAVGYAAGEKLLSVYRPAGTLTFTGKNEIGQWRPTPPANATMAFPWLKDVEPFAMTKPSQFRPGPPPTLDSRQYLREYNEAKEKGSIANHPTTGACPAPVDTDLARFWAGNYVVQWNQAARDIALDRQLSLGDTARLLALINLAAADAGIAIWDAKVYYNFWRPITAIRETGSEQPHGRRPELASIHREPEPLPAGRRGAKSRVPGLRVRRERAYGSLHRDAAAVFRHGLRAVRDLQGTSGSDGSYLHEPAHVPAYLRRCRRSGRRANLPRNPFPVSGRGSAASRNAHRVLDVLREIAAHIQEPLSESTPGSARRGAPRACSICGRPF